MPSAKVFYSVYVEIVETSSFLLAKIMDLRYFFESFCLNLIEYRLIIEFQTSVSTAQYQKAVKSHNDKKSCFVEEKE